MSRKIGLWPFSFMRKLVHQTTNRLLWTQLHKEIQLLSF